MKKDIPVRMHLLFRDFYRELQDYKSLSEDRGGECLDEFEKYLLERHYHELKPFWEYSPEECAEIDGGRYPNDEWLAAIIDCTDLKEALKHGDTLLEQIEVAWNWSNDYDFFCFDENAKILTAYTGGWSGCEDIMFALQMAFPFFTLECEHCVLRFDMMHFFKEDKK